MPRRALAEPVAPGGWKLVYNGKPNKIIDASDKANKKIDLRYSLGILVDNSDGHPIIDVVPGSPADKAGIGPNMKIVAVNGRRFDEDRLKDAIAATPTTKGIELLLENASYFTTVKLDYVGGPRFPHLERVETSPDILGKIIEPRINSVACAITGCGDSSRQAGHFADNGSEGESVSEKVGLMTVNIRLAADADAAEILAIYAPYCESTNVTFETIAPTLEQMAERIRRISDDYPWLVGEVDGRVTGYVYATRFRERAAYRWTAEVAIYVAMNAQRRGVGRALYTSLFSILRAQGYSKAVAGITLPNSASVGLHEGVGFRHTGHFPGVGYKDGTWLDVGWWQLELQPEIGNPPEPRPFKSLRETPAVAAALRRGPPIGKSPLRAARQSRDRRTWSVIMETGY